MHADEPGDPPGTGPVIGFEYLIHDGEAAVIRRAFQLYVDGLSAPRTVCRDTGRPSPPISHRSFPPERLGRATFSPRINSLTF